MEAMSIGLRWTIGSVYTTLVLGSSALVALRRIKPRLDLTEVVTRIRSWWVMVIAFTAALAVHPRAGIVFLLAVSLGAASELSRLLRVPFIPLGLATTGMYIALIAAAPAYVFAVGMVVVLASAAIWSAAGRAEGFGATLGGLAFGVAVAAALAHAAALLVSPAADGQPGRGAGMLVMLVIVTQGSDVAQFISGRIFGRRPVAPAVSPNKTVEGLIGGLVVAGGLGAGLALLLTNHGAAVGVLVGLMLGVAGFLGDLMMSALKRDAGVKDAGSLIPGHGGILDRVDSLLLAAPLFFYLLSGLA